MIAWSHHNFVRLRRERLKRQAIGFTVLGASIALGFSLFF